MLYKDAGVDINFLNQVKKRMGKKVSSTFKGKRGTVFGLFGGIYAWGENYLVSSCDSVGTKILVACALDKHNTVGMDLVNHSVNDILTTGARPIFFMDYIGFSKLSSKVLSQVVSGVVKACKKEGIVLVGGETAQLTRFYPDGIYDLVGFIVGIVDKRNFIDGSKIRPGDIILGLKSTGLHTNGYSLARKVLLRNYGFSTYIPELRCTIGEELLKVHRSYRKALEPRMKYIKGLAHITGGGFYDNIKRILPENCSVVIHKNTWKPLPVFSLIQKLGKVPESEMYRVFNMGIGMVCIIDKRHIKHFRAIKPIIIGEVVKGDFGVNLV
ncbi:phosphoribosylformylglycinamidine cyclo-ligase [candidate division WOR-3 bacterium 4484_100]|uniref:Phosphoribosylformylglycinamidine cyclo-ligase n=1 Tax=candidate division WOR-3 bacterium 4484_100 TaxID=1936077 RepID=A0A1V4QEX4_UNCW3|nr:MAG: phosphoribosylformylglycinamidine cyclo-ligase [candidate division WOR-3 bacterium 4484_100]